jgi:hypothetical protein
MDAALSSREDRRVVFHLYTLYMASLDARSLVSSDQVLADFLSHLETHAWNRARKTQGYDLVLWTSSTYSARWSDRFSRGARSGLECLRYFPGVVATIRRTVRPVS